MSSEGSAELLETGGRKMLGTLPTAKEAPLTRIEAAALKDIEEKGAVHWQMVFGGSDVLNRLEWKQRVKFGPDHYVRTTETHNKLFGGR
jgi:hypothetical protein